MRTRADVLAELNEQLMKQPTNFTSSLLRRAKINKLQAELRAFNEEILLTEAEIQSEAAREQN
ncbi:hypothetical protein [Macrococcus capreoli]|uniref:hypothetical protein n=1 Tax=Macrococcus capreoli TaxID=2982690 RepID=UPI0021D6006B|nr:hypothetical protein [Macrococcus sp. TMW 2.2395]MCU7558193.1 hypothetical protein [Macrococcus sp. TMW 2.2395]